MQFFWMNYIYMHELVMYNECMILWSRYTDVIMLFLVMSTGQSFHLEIHATLMCFRAIKSMLRQYSVSIISFVFCPLLLWRIFILTFREFDNHTFLVCIFKDYQLRPPSLIYYATKQFHFCCLLICTYNALVHWHVCFMYDGKTMCMFTDACSYFWYVFVVQEQDLKLSELESENRKMKVELEEFRTEATHLKNQQATIRRLEERNRQLEQQVINASDIVVYGYIMSRFLSFLEENTRWCLYMLLPVFNLICTGLLSGSGSYFDHLFFISVMKPLSQKLKLLGESTTMVFNILNL